MRGATLTEIRDSSAYRVIATLVTILALQSCATMNPDYEAPSVSVNSFKTLPTEGGLPNFEIGLRVLNPNATPLELRGMSFAISLDGHQLIKGVGNNLPVIEPYGAGDFTVTASASMLAGVRLISDMISAPKEQFNYELQAKLDVGAFRPAIRIKDAGKISLRSTPTEQIYFESN